VAMANTIRSSLIAAACVIAQSAANAQGTPPPQTGGDATANSTAGNPGAPTGGPEIIITATKRAERLENVPASVIALSGAALSDAGVRVSMAPSSTYTHPTIRGITTTFSVAGSEPNVTTYIDGFYHVNSFDLLQDFSNIQDVQILKGPQGTLYGRNASGGTILIETLGPTDKLHVEGSASYAPRFNDRTATAFVSGPITHGISFSLAAGYSENEGQWTDINNFAPGIPISTQVFTFGGHTPPYSPASFEKRPSSNRTAPYDNWSVRGKLLFDFHPVKLTLTYAHNYLSDAWALARQNDKSGTNGLPADPASSYNGYPVATQRDTTSLPYLPFIHINSNEFDAKAEFDLGAIGTLISRTSYTREADLDANDINSTPAVAQFTNVPAGAVIDLVNGNKRNTVVEQLDYNGHFGAFSLLAGAFYLHDNTFTYLNIQDTGAATGPVSNLVYLHASAWAAYIEGQYNIGKLYLTVGGRYSEEKKSLYAPAWIASGAVATSGSPCYANGLPNPLCNSGPVETKAHAFTPSASIRYNIADRTNIYASYTQGFKAPVINSVAPFNALKPEKSTGYEIGIKTARGGFRGEVSGFYTKMTNAQVAALNAAFPTATTLVENAGGAKIYGIDASLTYKFPNMPLNVHAGFEWLHARYTNYPNASNTIILPNGTNGTVSADWSGRQMIRAPHFSGTVSADYTMHLAGGSLVASGTVTFQSQQAPSNGSYQCDRVSHNAAGGDIPYVAGTLGYCAAGTDPKKKGRFLVPGYALVNGQLAWTDPSGHYTLAVYCNNLTDKRYKLLTRGLFYGTNYIWNKPREIGVSGSFKF